MDQTYAFHPKKDYMETELMNIKNQTYVQSQKSKSLTEVKVLSQKLPTEITEMEITLEKSSISETELPTTLPLIPVLKD